MQSACNALAFAIYTECMSSVLLSTGNDGRWHLGIGDPTAVGWVTVAAYFATAILAFRAYAAANRSANELLPAEPEQARAQRQLASLWQLVLFVMLLLGINKQLDLQTLFTELMRDLFRGLDLYEQRRTYQLAFIVAIGCGGTVALAGLTYRFWGVLRRALGAVIGLGVVVTFVVVRAASFHHVDLLLRSGPLPLNVVLELGGIGVLAYSALRATQRDASSRALAPGMTP